MLLQGLSGGTPLPIPPTRALERASLKQYCPYSPSQATPSSSLGLAAPSWRMSREFRVENENQFSPKRKTRL